MSFKSFLLSLLPTRTVYEYYDIIHPGPGFRSWVGIDGTYFKWEPLARTRGARDYLLAAYPAGHHESGWMPIYKRLCYEDQWVNSLGTDGLDAEIEREIADFTAYFYSLPTKERLRIDPRWTAPGKYDFSLPFPAE
jgi:hypothetical protein